MKITEIREATASIASDIRNAYIDFSKMDVSVVAVVTDVIRDGKPIVGYGFNSNGRYAQGGLLRHRFLPRLRDADPKSLINDAGDNLDPFRIWDTMMKNEKPGGHGERSVAVGVVDMAVWDAVAKIAGKPLYKYLAETYGNGKPDDKVYVYAAGGYYYPDKDVEKLQDEMKGYLAMGYDTVKMKIGGVPLADDLKRIEGVLKIVDRGNQLAVDANGRFDLERALDYAKAMAPYNLKWYEEAGDPLDYALQAELSKVYEPPMATGENLFSMIDSKNLLRCGGMRPDRDILQMDPVLSYGLVEYMRILDMMRELGWSPRQCIPHGGHQFSLNIAAGLGLGGNESYPGIFQPFGGFADSTPVENGFIGMPDVPGIGFEDKAELMELFKRELI